MVSASAKQNVLKVSRIKPKRCSSVIFRRALGNQPGEIGHVLAPHARREVISLVLLIVPSSCSSGADAMPFSGGNRHSPRQSRYMTANDRGRRASTSATVPSCPAFKTYGRQIVCAISTRASGVIICATVPRCIWSKARRTGTPRSYRPPASASMSRSAATVRSGLQFSTSSRGFSPRFADAAGSWTSSASLMASAIPSSDSKLASLLILGPPSTKRRATRRSLKSMPVGGRAIRTRRPSRFQRQAQSSRRGFAGFVAIGEHDHVAHVAPADRGRAARRSKAPPRPDVRSPALRKGMFRCLHRPSARRPAGRGAPRRRDTDRASSSPDRPAPCRHRRGQERCGGLRAARRRRRASPAPTIAGQMPPEGCFSPGWKRNRRGRQRRARASADMSRPAFPRPTLGRARSPAPPCCASASASGSSETRSWRSRAKRPERLPGRLPKAARAKDGDHVALIATGMAAHEHLAIPARADRKARLAILMRRAARHPCCARAAPAKGFGDGFSGHGAPRLPSVGRCRWWQRSFFRPAPIRRARRRSR